MATTKTKDKAAPVTTPEPQALAVLPPADLTATLEAEFRRAKICISAAKGYVLQASGFMVLGGVELKRLKALYGIKRGGDRKSADQTRNASGLIPKWSDLVKQHLDITDDTATKYIDMAENAKKRCSILVELEETLLTTPLIALPEEQQTAIVNAVRKVTDGKTASSLMEEFGVVKAAPGIKESARGKGGNSTKKKESPEDAAQNRAQFVKTLRSLRLDNVKAYLDGLYHLPLEGNYNGDAEVIGLSDMVEELEHWLRDSKKAAAAISAALHDSPEKDESKRLKAAQTTALQKVA